MTKQTAFHIYLLTVGRRVVDFILGVTPIFIFKPATFKFNSHPSTFRPNSVKPLQVACG